MKGSTRSVIAALASAFMPGLGQLIQGRLFAAVFQFVLAGVLWMAVGHGGVGVGAHWAVHLYSVLDAALYQQVERFVSGRAADRARNET